MEIEAYIIENLSNYYTIVKKSNWVYTEIDEDLVKMIFKEYAKELQFGAGYPGYEDTILNLYEYAKIKVTKFFRNLHIIATSNAENSIFIGNLSSSIFKDIAIKLTKTFAGIHLLVELKQIKHITTTYKTGIDSLQQGRLLIYRNRDSDSSSKHLLADGIAEKATHPIWETLNSYLGEWNCRCYVVIASPGKNRTSSDKLSTLQGLGLAPEKDSVSEINYNTPLTDSRVRVFSPRSQMFKDYETIRKTYTNKNK